MKKTLLHILMHNGRLLQRAVETELASLGLHHGQGRILQAIASGGEITQADLARQMDIQPATVTTMLKPLEQKKLVSRHLDDKTNRAVIVSLTPAGKRACTEILAAWDRVEARMLKPLPLSGLTELFQNLELIRDALGGKNPFDKNPKESQ